MPSACLNGETGKQDERRYVDETHAFNANRPRLLAADNGCGPNDARRRVEYDRRSVTAGHHQAALERNRGDGDDAVAGHRSVSVVLEEEDTGVCARRNRFG